MAKFLSAILGTLWLTFGVLNAAVAAVPSPDVRPATTIEEMVPLFSSPSSDARTVGHIAAGGTRVAVLDTLDDWCRVRVGGGIAWVEACRLAPAAPAPVAAVTADPTMARTEDVAPRRDDPPPLVDSPPDPPTAPAPMLLAAAATGDAASAPEAEEEPAQEQYEDGYVDEIVIDRIEFEGNTVVATEDLKKATAEYLEMPLTLEDMASLADLVTLAYQERGYILARAYLPEQELSEGVLKIAVAEGRIGKIVVAGNKKYESRVVKRYFNAQKRHEVARENLLEKGLLLANTTPGVKTDIVLKEGAEAGEVDVVVNTREDDRPTFGLSLSADVNNYGIEQISQHRYGVDMQVVDHTFGSTLDLRGIAGERYLQTSMGNAMLQIPINGLGTKLGFTYLESDYGLRQDASSGGAGTVGLDTLFFGDTVYKGAFITHPLWIKRDRSLYFTLGGEAKYSESKLTETQGILYINELKEAYLTIDYESLDRFLGKNTVSLRMYKGEIETHEDQAINPSRGDPDVRFERYSLNLVRIQKLYGNTNLMLRGWVQHTDQRLLPMEQVSVGGYGTVRGYEPVFARSGDRGYNLSAELIFAPPYMADKELFGQRLAQLVQFALFYDTGGVFRMEPLSTGEAKREYLSGFGCGLRVFYKNRFSFKYDLGFPSSKYDGTGDMVHYFSFQMTAF